MQRQFMRGGPASIGYMALIIGTKGAPALYMRGACVGGEVQGGVPNGRVYQNYPEPRLKDWEQACIDDGVSRLREVKRQVDPRDARYPQGFFHFPQSIRP